MGLPQLAQFDPQAFIQAGQQGRQQRTLADVGRYASTGDYKGAAAAAFAGGQPDIAMHLQQFSNDQKQVLLGKISSAAQAADSPEKWTQFQTYVKTLDPSYVTPDYSQRGQVVSLGQSTQDQIANQQRAQQLQIDSQRNMIQAAQYKYLGVDIPGMPGSGGANSGVDPATAPLPTNGGAPTNSQPIQPAPPQVGTNGGMPNGQQPQTIDLRNPTPPAPVSTRFDAGFGTQSPSQPPTPAQAPPPSGSQQAIAPPPPSGPLSFNSDITAKVAAITNPNQPTMLFAGLSLNGLKQGADIYLANGGSTQSIGRGTSPMVMAQRNTVINYAGALADKMGMTVPEITAAYKANASAATQIVQRVAKIDTTAQTLSTQFPRMAQLADKVGNLGITESDLTAGKAAYTRKFGSVDASNYYDLIQTLRSDYAAMQASVAGGRGGQFFAANAMDAIPAGLTSAQYIGIGQTIAQSAVNAKLASGQEAQSLIMNGNSPTGAVGGGAQNDPLGLR